MARTSRPGAGFAARRRAAPLGDLRNLARGSRPAHWIAFIVSGAFVVVGVAWMILTDIVLYHVVDDPEVVARFETAKGWTFVAVAGLLVYAVTAFVTDRLARVWRLTAAIVESIGDGVLLLGEDRRIAHANPAAQRMLGCSFDVLVGMGAPEFSRRFRVSYPNGALVPPEKFASQRVFDQGGVLRYKALLHSADHGELVFTSTATAVRASVDEPACWAVSVLHDITEIESLERMRDQFLSASAHSLRTPIAIAKANAQALLAVLDGDQRGAARSLERQCDRIDRLVQNLLVLARLRTQTLQLHVAEVPLRPLVDKIGRESVWSWRHEVRTRVDGEPRIYGDPERVSLVIRNLMNEACRLSPARSRVWLHASDEGGRVTIDVRYRPVPWRESAGHLYGEYDDIGIGRKVSRMVVDAHGGKLSERSAGADLVLSIHLPAASGANA